ncbi:hypothetical protein P7C70_g3725, partial [Phenoliferia sp. Uapishka_3]
MSSHLHSSPHRIKRSRTQHEPRACSLYTYPLVTDTLPVYETLTITWNPSCLTISASTIDLYLNVEEASGLNAVHEWTGIEYSAGTLETQLKPGWWNASTGAGSASGQFIITPHGSPIWDTSAPSGPLFSIAYNGTYPASVTATAESPVYTGPSVESVSSTSTSSALSGGKLGAAVVFPVLAVIACIGAYVAWNKFRKRPEQKRWSAVIDQRMSMISQGTWQPPRPSMSSRPGSQYQHSHTGSFSGADTSHHRPSHSINSFGQHPFSDSNRPSSSYNRPSSAYSLSPVPSPLGGGIRPLPPAEMRQIGQGERSSKVSFSDANTRPSFSSSRNPGPSSLRNATGSDQHSRNSSYYASAHGRSASLGASMRGSMYAEPSPPLPRNNSSFEQLADGLPAPSPSSVRSSPSSTSIFLAAPASPTRTRKPSNLSISQTRVRDSIADPALNKELADLPAIALMRDGELAYNPSLNSSTSSLPESPFTENPATTLLESSAASRIDEGTDFTYMPMDTARNSMMSPDDLLRSYAVKRETSSSPNLQTLAKKSSSSKLSTSKSTGSFLSAPRKLMGRLRSGTQSPVVEYEEDQEREREVMQKTREKSPFEDPRLSEEKRESEETAKREGGSDWRKTAMTVESRYSSDHRDAETSEQEFGAAS